MFFKLELILFFTMFVLVFQVGWAAASPSFGYSAGAAGWDAYGGAGHDVHGAYTSNVAHSLAYAAQKPAVAAAR